MGEKKKKKLHTGKLAQTQELWAGGLAHIHEHIVHTRIWTQQALQSQRDYNAQCQCVALFS